MAARSADVEDGLLDRAARRLEPRRRLVERWCVHVGEHHACSVLGHHLGKGETKPAGGAGDERDLAADVEQLLLLHLLGSFQIR